MKANLCEHDNLKEHGCHCETCTSCGKTVYPCSRHRKNSDLEEVERSEG